MRLHVSQCQECQLACREMQSGMSRFVAFRDSIVVPVPVARTRALKERLLAESGSRPFNSVLSRLRGFFQLNSPRRLAFAMGGATFCLFLWLFVYLGAPRQSVYASQLLNDARHASDSLLARSKVLNQKVRLRRGAVVFDESVQHGRKTSVQAQEVSVDPQLRQTLELAHVDLSDPLNANDFADWRGAQQEHTDSVKETAQGVTITTSVAGAAIAEESLTLSRSGWRPISRSVEVRGEVPIEISEVSYDIVDSASVLPESAGSSPASGAGASIAAPSASAEVTADELETSELDLREAFRSLGADVTASPEIWRSEKTVLFRAYPLSPAQAEQIGKAVTRIPHVKEADKQPGHPATAGMAAAASAAFMTTPPLASALQDKLGSTQAVNGFLDSLHTRSTRALADAAALDRLAKRYPVDSIKALPPALRVRVNRLAASVLSSLQHDSADYVKAMSPVLDQMAQQLDVKDPGDDSSNLPSCLAWQQNADLAAPQLRNLETSVDLLFVPSQTEKPAVLSARELLARSLVSRSFLERHLMSTCQLFAAN